MSRTLTSPTIAGPREYPTVIAPTPATKLSRRGVLKLSFWSALAALLAGAGAGLLNSVYPRNVAGFGGRVVVPAAKVPPAGAPPPQNIEGRFWLVNLAPGEGRIAGDGAETAGGLVALWRKCPHLGCTIPWRESYRSPHDAEGRRGWFLCPCHGSTYSKAGVRIFGPAARSMDTMLIEVDRAGNVIVDTGKITKGDAANPARAVPPQAAT